MKLYRSPLSYACRDLAVSAGKWVRKAASAHAPGRLTGKLAKLLVLHTAVLRGENLPETTVEMIQVSSLQGLSALGAASFKSSAPGRSITSIWFEGGRFAVVKDGPATDRGLAIEAVMLKSVKLQGSVVVPDLLGYQKAEDRVRLITAGIQGIPTRDERVGLRAAVALGRAGITHGDLAPWNVLAQPSPPSLVLLDWEKAATTWRPYQDLIHFLIRKSRCLPVKPRG